MKINIMKKYILIVSCLFALNSFSQTYEFDRVNVYSKKISTSLKTKGTIFISDSLITIKYNKGNTPIQKYYVKRSSDNGSVKQYLSDIEKMVTPQQVRFTLQESSIYKKTPFMFVMDIKDEFTEGTSTLSYFMRLKETN